MVSFVSLYSGSSKNASLLKYKNTNILVDCGGSFKQIKDQLSKVDMNISDIDALFITHSHSDHINALPMIINNTEIPIYTSYGTHEEIFDKGINMPKYRRIIIPDKQEFSIGNIDASAFKTPHDTKFSIGFNFYLGNKSMSYATDIGYMSDELLQEFKGRDFLFFESNHDVEMLKNSKRAEFIKQRILSNEGHLSNETSALYSSKLVKMGLKRLMLGHLSGEATTPELAYNVTKEKMESEGIKINNDLLLSVATRDVLSEIITF